MRAIARLSFLTVRRLGREKRPQLSILVRRTRSLRLWSSGLRGVTYLVRDSSPRVSVAPERCIHDSVQFTVGRIRHLLGSRRPSYARTKHNIHVCLGNPLRASRPVPNCGTIFCRCPYAGENFLRTHRSPGNHHFRRALENHKFAASANTNGYLTAGALGPKRDDLTRTSTAIFLLEFRDALAGHERPRHQ